MVDTDMRRNLQEAANLWLADNLDDLYWALLLLPVRRTADHFEPLHHLSKHHGDDRELAEITALLLCTDERWQAGSHRFLHAVENRDVLSDDQLDTLARWLLWADRPVLELPASLVHSDEPPSQHTGVEEGGTVQVPRRLRPPLRRWSAGRLLRRRHHTLAQVLARADALEAAHASAVVAGCLDAAPSLTTDDQETVITVGLADSNGAVRQQALELMVARGRVHEARTLAASDRNAKVRRWGQSIQTQLSGLRR